jgi:hypothetical protein
MASTNVPRIHGWGNLSYLLLSGALGPSPLQGGGLRTPFLFDPRLIGVAAPTRPRVWDFPFFSRLVQHDVPAKSWFLGRPRPLTRLSTLPAQGYLWVHLPLLTSPRGASPVPICRRTSGVPTRGPICAGVPCVPHPTEDNRMDSMNDFQQENTPMKLPKSLWMLSLIPLLAGLWCNEARSSFDSLEVLT